MNKDTKVCSCCQEEKDSTCFYQRNGKSVSQCKECASQKAKIYRKNNKEAIKERKKRYHQKNKEKINEKKKRHYKENKEAVLKASKKWRSKNKKKKSLTDKIYREKNREAVLKRKNEYYHKNKEEISKKQKEFRKNNKEKIRAQKKKSYLKRRDKILKYQKEYVQKNKPKIRKHLLEKRQNNPKLRLEHNFSSAIQGALKGKKNWRSWESLVGYNVDELKSHLESLFEPWMTWENYGNPNGDHTDCWHVDHIIPKSHFNYQTPEDEEFRLCWSLKNLQPKEAKENIPKGNRYIG